MPSLTCKPRGPATRPGEQCWQWESCSSTAEALRVTEFLVTAMAQADYPERDRFGMRLALEEAVVNAVKHGNRDDQSKRVRVFIRIGRGRVVAEVEDEGEGFDPGRVPDPTASENLERPGGRGLLMMKHYATWVRFRGRGNRVTLCRHRSAG